MTDAIIEFTGVDKAFGDHVVYRGMDLRVFQGETLSIIGGSGQGKSVCLKMMIGLLVPDGGVVSYRGDDVHALDSEGLRQIRRRVAYVFQGGALFDSMTVEDNVAYALREHTDMSYAQIRDRVVECLDMVGLPDTLLDLMPANLSGGMRKRVALARSIAIEPEVILYDEPTTGLDPRNITRIGEMIMKLQRELNVTSVVVTHEMPIAFDVADRVAMLHDKRFPFVAPPDDLAASEEPEVRDFVQGNIRR